MTRTRRRLLAWPLVLTLALVLTGGAGAAAWWTASQTVQATATAAVIAPATNIRCTTTGGTLTRTATVAWNAAAQVPASYRVTIRSGTTVTTTTVPGTQTQLVISQSLLGGLLGSILDLLLGGAVLNVSVQAVHSSGWVSVPTGTVGVRNAPLLQAGIVCA
ncbi:hypothetical protein [Oerskovia flava]|uniref:hypothetical protein n=1 Tax=Oerskovia flava TaxID=2986422 RepID=UPI00223EFDDE|nr:hypothetical protein [Oerskovia sp. JB1-3-2]